MKINWREKVKEEFLYTKDEKLKDKPVSEIDDSKLLIKLGGIIDLANMRGFESVDYEVVKAENDHVVVKCIITWSEATIDGVTLPRQTFSSIASATRQNADNFWHYLLETCAENRAFVRAVRKYLGVNIVGEDEVKKEAETPKVLAEIPNPQNTLRSICEKLGIQDITSLKTALRKHYTAGRFDQNFANTIKGWQDFSDIKPKECRAIIALLQIK